MQYFGISLNIKKIKNVTLFHFIKPHMLVKYYVSKKKATSNFEVAFLCFKILKPSII